MVDYYIQPKTFWRHSKTGRVLMLATFDMQSGECLLFDECGRETRINGNVLENLYGEIGDVEARRLIDQAGRHGWDKSPSRPINIRPLVSLAIVDEIKRGRGRPRKQKIVYGKN